MFNNCNSGTNGEAFFFRYIEPYIKVIFDVGCRYDSEFLEFMGDVHYFDPMPEFIEKMRGNVHNNNSYLNSVGLSDKAEDIWYYPKYQSFYDRIASCNSSDDQNKILLKTITGEEYMTDKNIPFVDFLKIDTEGHELSVIKGFNERIRDIKIVQFEYGGTFIDNNIKLAEVIDHLRNHGFSQFSYLTPHGLTLITDFTDHYQYCNIVCINTRYIEQLPSFKFV